MLFSFVYIVLSVSSFCPSFRKIEIAVIVSLIILSPGLFSGGSLSLLFDETSADIADSNFSSGTYFFGYSDWAYDISVIIFFLKALVIFLSYSLLMGYAVFTMKEKREPTLSEPNLSICWLTKVSMARFTSGLICKTLDIFSRLLVWTNLKISSLSSITPSFFNSLLKNWVKRMVTNSG